MCVHSQLVRPGLKGEMVELYNHPLHHKIMYMRGHHIHRVDPSLSLHALFAKSLEYQMLSMHSNLQASLHMVQPNEI